MHPSSSKLEAPGTVSCRVERHRAGVKAETLDLVVEEMPVALVFNGISHAVMMATPMDLEVFALGFALSEGIVSHASEILGIEASRSTLGIEVAIQISQRTFANLKERRRTLAGRSGCGLCGLESLESLDINPSRIEPACPQASIDASSLARAVEGLPARQPLMQLTGGMHAAAWCDMDGQILAAYEDVGRHNALDKLIGHLSHQPFNPGEGFVLMSSRASYELIRKAARVGMPTVAAMSAPTSLAIDVARQAGIRLFGFCRENGHTQYT